MQPEKIEAALDKILAENRVTIAKLLTNSTYTWSNLVQPLEEIEDRLDQFWAPISNLHGVAQTPALREAYNQCLPKLTAYHTEIAQNETLYKAFLNLKNNADYIKLNKIQQHIIDNELRDFKLSGIDLPPAAKQRYAEIRTQLAKLTTQFEENVMDATESWTLHITDKEKLTGIPVHILTTAAEAAQQKNLTGWLLTLDFPCYYAVISYADNRALRQEIYTAYITRASEQGPQAGQFDNSKIMLDILTLRKELSVLLDRKNYAEFALTKRMVKQPQDVLDFLTQLINHVRPKAEQEF